MAKLIFILAVLFAPFSLYAQGVGLGIKAGANFSNMSGDNVNTSSITSYHAGAFANIKFSHKWGVTPEVLWSAQGAEIDNKKLKTDFITVPIMLRWRVIDLISIEAGPQFNFLSNAKLDGVDVKDDLASSTTSIAFGALVHLPLSLHGGIRYVMGMSDLSDDANVELKDQTFQLYIGWTIFGSK